MIDVFILGSCATRDAFEFPFSEKLKLADYNARTSLASLVCKPRIERQVLDQIPSSFQKRMVERDMSKKFWLRLEGYSNGALVIDLVDDRFRLRRFRDGSAHTVSAEYGKTRKFWSKDPSTTYDFDHAEVDALWRVGLDKLSSVYETTQNLTLLVNCVYFLPTADAGDNGPDGTAKMNDYLSSRYELLRERFGSPALIEYPEGMLATDAGHKWGLAPFHYSEDVYRHLVGQICKRTVSANKDQ